VLDLRIGIHIAVFYKCITTLLRKNDKSCFKWIPFIAGLFVLGTANIACSLHFNQLAFIDERQYPGGPAAFLTEKQSDSANVGAVATSIIMMIAADIFMVKICVLKHRGCPENVSVLDLSYPRSVEKNDCHWDYIDSITRFNR